MNNFNVRCCFFILFFFLFEKEFYKNSAALLPYIPSHGSKENNCNLESCVLNSEKVYYDSNWDRMPQGFGNSRILRDNGNNENDDDYIRDNEERTGGENDGKLFSENVFYEKEEEEYKVGEDEGEEYEGGEDEGGEDEGEEHEGGEDEGEEYEGGEDGYLMNSEQRYGSGSELLDGKLDTADGVESDSGAKRKMSKKEEEAEDHKIDKLINEEMKKNEKAEEGDINKRIEADVVEDEKNRQGKRIKKLNCSNKLNYIQVTGNVKREEDIFGVKDEGSSQNVTEIQLKQKRNNANVPNEYNEKVINIKTGGEEQLYKNIDHVEKRNKIKNNDLIFMEKTLHVGGVGVGGKNRDESTIQIQERKSEKSAPTKHDESSFLHLKIMSNKIPLNFGNLYDGTSYTNNLEKAIYKHSNESVFEPSFKSETNIRTSRYKDSPLNFSSIKQDESDDPLPMNFRIINSVVKVTDDEYNKLMNKNSVNVYDQNALVEYQYENFEVKEGDQYNGENEMENEGKNNDEQNLNDENKYDEDGDLDGNEKSDDENKDSDGRANFDGTLATYAIGILIAVIILLLIFVIYYYDIINKIKRQLNAKRKSNKTMAISNTKSAELYLDDTYTERNHV
ncbi:hypothetical protein, conserved [Plasmodium gonderi]|uniref:Variable surface protein n=1 Tax=Plasmodium gonderi TaxID=77519 RepID=A0A1Y1JM32_PLAGO|nr:hypothetical protein, conserved [Plasmodium gonderi]GAW81443.1 hypothetical protein, conserved [Plasmodium gonderi]